jgi:cytochrome P450
MNLVSELDLPVLDRPAPVLWADSYHSQLAGLRAQSAWLARSDQGYVVLSRDAAEFFLRCRGTAFPGREIAAAVEVDSGPLAAHIDASIVNMRGEPHRRLRSLTGPAFGPRAADRLRPVMRGFLAHLWARVGAYGSCDFVPAIAKPYPSLIVATMLGAPHQDAGRLREWSSWMRRQFDVAALKTKLPEIERAVKEASEYVTWLLTTRRPQPDDLLSTLSGAGLSDGECVTLVLNLLAEGIDATAAQLAHAIRLFAAHPAQWELLAERPALVAAAVDEVLRFEPVTPFTARICVTDVSYRGVLFPVGTFVAICAESANRDCPAGERFDITVPRETRPLTFGAGSHHCLGVNLARAELEEALAFLTLRMGSLRLDCVPRFCGTDGLYGIDKLVITWSGS